MSDGNTEDQAEGYNWSEHLEDLHEESSRTHFLDVWTRLAIIERVGPLGEEPTVLDLGCSSGYLLEDLRKRWPRSELAGLDIVHSGLRKARAGGVGASVVQASASELPFADASADGVVSANLLEHIERDDLALREVHRVLKPGRRAVFVVPAGPGTYDYYDRFLHHQRRYAKGELAAKARAASLEVLEDFYIGSVIFPAFWLVKKRNRLRFDHLGGTALEEKVSADIAGTGNSRIGQMTATLEHWLLARRLRIPFGIRMVTVVQRPRAG